jgi:plastocyanin
MVRRVRHVPIFLSLLAVLLLVLPIHARADKTVLVVDFAFSPRDIAVLPGERVTWVWAEGFHTTTSGIDENDPNAGLLWDAMMFPGTDPVSYVFTVPGFFPYFCRFHTGLDMFGSVTVAASPTATHPASWGSIKSLYR